MTTKQRRIFVAVPIVTSEDGKYCGEGCEFMTGQGCDLAGLEQSGVQKRFRDCLAAERRMKKIMEKAREEMEDFPSATSSGWDIKKRGRKE